MAAFGEHNYGSPLGAFEPTQIFGRDGRALYSYSGFSSRAGVTELRADSFSDISGFSGFSAICGPQGLEFLPWKPILTFPLNFEILEGDNVIITWRESIPTDACYEPVTYEIQFTRTMSKDIGWRTIARKLAQGTISYAFDLRTVPYTTDAGFRIRAKDRKGLFSKWNYNPVPVTVANHPPNSPSIVYPTVGTVIDNYLNIVWREAPIKDIDGHKVWYRIEITSAYSSGGSWSAVPGATALPEGTTSFTVDATNFQEGTDYALRIIPYDELGEKGTPAIIAGLRVQHSGIFIIDTVPPVGEVQINDGEPFTKDHRVRLDLYAFDATTGIRDVRFKNHTDNEWSSWDTYTQEKFWDLSDGEGVKRVQVQYRDYAFNVSEVCDCDIISRVICDEGNTTDLEEWSGKLYVSFDTNGNMIEYKVWPRRVLYTPSYSGFSGISGFSGWSGSSGASGISGLSGFSGQQYQSISERQITAMAKMTDFLYLSGYNPDSGFSTVYRYDFPILAVITQITAKVNTMVSFLDKLYIGLEDGRILCYDGTSYSTVRSESSSIVRIKTDGSLLYVSTLGSDSYLTFDGLVWKTFLI